MKNIQGYFTRNGARKPVSACVDDLSFNGDRIDAKSRMIIDH